MVVRGGIGEGRVDYLGKVSSFFSIQSNSSGMAQAWRVGLESSLGKKANRGL